MTQIQYSGFELEYFDTAQNFRNYQLHLIKPYLKGSFLEVGPGQGGLTKLYKNYLKKITLIEPDKKLYKSLKKKFKNDKKIIIKNSLLENINQKYDVIIYFDVLEHIKKDLRELRIAKNKLNKAGYLIINVPAHQQFYNDFDKRVGHFKRYNKKDFFLMSKKTKLKIINMSYYDSVGFLLLIISKLFSLNQSNLKNKVSFWNLLIPLSKIIDYFTFNKIGKSLLCILKND
tara:strand:- start:1995 stop:2684 length:690 start_codon:yes stop_codon:yes gene_type:complete